MRFQVRAFASAGTAEKNYYQILGIDTVATDSQIKDAYRALAKRYHPDVRSQSDSSAAEHDPDVEKFRDVVEAYQVLSVKESRAVFDISMKRNPQNYTVDSASKFDAMMSREGRDRSGVAPTRVQGTYAATRMAELAKERAKYNVNHLGYYQGGVPQPNRGPIRGKALGRPGHFHAPDLHNFLDFQHGDKHRVTTEDAVKFKHFMGTDKADFARTMPNYQMHYDTTFEYMRDRDFWLKVILGWTAVGYAFSRYQVEKDRARMHERVSGFPNTPAHHVVNQGGVVVKKQFTGFKKYYKSNDEVLEWYRMMYPDAFK